jgi:hypothetical protein
VIAAATRKTILKKIAKRSTASSPCATSTCVWTNGASDASVAPITRA